MFPLSIPSVPSTTAYIPKVMTYIPENTAQISLMPFALPKEPLISFLRFGKARKAIAKIIAA